MKINLLLVAAIFRNIMHCSKTSSPFYASATALNALLACSPAGSGQGTNPQ